jgi:hypothetical protein
LIHRGARQRWRLATPGVDRSMGASATEPSSGAHAWRPLGGR